MFIKTYKGRHSTCLRVGFLIIKIFKEGLFLNWKKEVLALKLLKRESFVPKVYFYFPNVIVRSFVVGLDFKTYLKKEKNKNRLKKVIIKILKACEIMDKYKIKKEELNRPTKNIIVGKNFNIYMIDFERTKFGKEGNVKEFCGFLISKIKNKKKALELFKSKKLEELVDLFLKEWN